MRTKLSTGQGFRWCLTVIHRQAANARRKYKRWGQESLLLNTQTDNGNEWGDTIPCPKSDQEFSEHEMVMLLRTLPDLQYRVMLGLYALDLSQSEVAHQLGITQQHVSRLKRQALHTLRERLR